MHNFKNLHIWKKAMNLTMDIYSISSQFPKEELFTLTAQMRRASISIPSNIAEGCGRGTDKQLAYFLEVAIGSICELETQIYLSYRLEYIAKERLNEMVEKMSELRKMIFGFKNNLKNL